MASAREPSLMGARWWIRIDRFFDRLSTVALTASAALLFLMMVLMGVEISARTFFGVSTQISEEYSGYLFAWMTLAAFLYAQRHQRFLRVDVVRLRLPFRLRTVMDGVAAVLAALLTAIILYSAWEVFYASWSFQTTSIQYSQTPLYLPQAIMPLGFALLFLAFMHTAVKLFVQAAGSIPTKNEETA